MMSSVKLAKTLMADALRLPIDKLYDIVLEVNKWFFYCINATRNFIEIVMGTFKKSCHYMQRKGKLLAEMKLFGNIYFDNYC